MVEKDADVFAMAVGEACKNAILYSKGNDKFELVLLLSKKRIIAEIINKGDPIDLNSVKAFDKDQDFMQYKNGGLGIPIIKKFMDEVNYERKNGRNKLTLVRKISPGQK
jgi:anti-sigma regulatory factor (Ser/Thr protein kinase)